MTEIRVERRRSAWPWLVALLALVLVVWGVVAVMDTDEAGTEQAGVADDPYAPAPVGTSGSIAAPVSEYSSFAEGEEELTPGREHEYTAEGIERLSAALHAVVEQRPGDNQTRSRFERFQQIADRLQQNPESPEHADMVRQVFTSAVDVLETAGVEAGNLSALRETATSISPERSLLDQKEQVQRFFRESADVLERAAA